MKTIENIPIWGDPVDQGALKQIITCARNADKSAMMADHHKGYAVPIGGVVAYRDHISPSGVGYDIACGNKAVRLDISADEVRKNIKKIMNDIWDKISFGLGMKNKIKVEHELFEDPSWQIDALKPLKGLAQSQLGTVGAGNHYIDIFTDQMERIWLGVHFGSRGLGHKTATWFLKKGGAKDGMDVEPLLLPVKSDLGQQYLKAMELAGQYAYAGRHWVCTYVAKLMGARILEEVHNHHNFAWQEKHAGQDYWVIRKGATPAFPGQKGFVGGSMGDISVILEGIESNESKAALYSTVHGAGRVMSRTAARGKRKWKTGKTIKPGLISRKMMLDWVKQKNVELRGADTDESPHCYKRLPDVLNAHQNTIKIVHTLKPLGVAMAGPDIHDPYKD